MAHLYFVRHGQTEWNEANKICGATDSALTPLGHQQAEETGRKLLAMGVHVDQIIHSPLSRARDTAQHIADIIGAPMMPDPRLVEQCFGIFEGEQRGTPEFMEAKKNLAYRYETGESMMQVAQRIYNLLDELKASPKTYLLVAHNGVSRVVQSYFYEMTNEEFAAFSVPNCGILDYTWDHSQSPQQF